MQIDIPTPRQLRDYLAENRISGSEAARLVMIDRSKFRLYMIDEDKPGHKPCPHSVWYTLTDKISKRKIRLRGLSA